LVFELVIELAIVREFGIASNRYSDIVVAQVSWDVARGVSFWLKVPSIRIARSTVGYKQSRGTVKTDDFLTTVLIEPTRSKIYKDR
jgi:hypothetical protein